MTHSVYGALILMIVVIYLVRLLPMILIRKNITNQWIQSFLFYVPYVTLAVMTFPAILTVTDHMMAGLFALIIGVIMAFVSGDLFVVAISCCAAVFVAGFIL